MKLYAELLNIRSSPSKITSKPREVNGFSKLHKKLIIYGLVLLLLCWIGNILYYNNKEIKEPLFLKHYYALQDGMGDFNLYYVQKINSQDKVSSIVFPEIGQNPVNFTENDDNNTDYNIDKRYYALKTIRIIIYNGDMSNMPAEYKNKIITKAKIQFSNGKSMNVSLGKIYFASDEVKDNGLEQRSTTVSSDNTEYYTYWIKKDIMITGINYQFNKQVNGMLEINIDGKAISKNSFPIRLNSVGMVSIGDKMNLNKNNAYFFNFDILTEDLQGNKGKSSCFIGSIFQPPENLNVDTLKKNSRGE